MSLLSEDRGGRPDRLESKDVREVKLSAWTIGERPEMS